MNAAEELTSEQEAMVVDKQKTATDGQSTSYLIELGNIQLTLQFLTLYKLCGIGSRDNFKH